MNNKKYWFFGSKLNSILLLILIILMIIALRWMSHDRETYLYSQGNKSLVVLPQNNPNHKIIKEELNNTCGNEESLKITSPKGEDYKIFEKIHITWSTCNIGNDGLGEYAVLQLKRFDKSGKELLPALPIADSSNARATMHSGYQDYYIPEYETFPSKGSDGYLVSLTDKDVKYKVYMQVKTKTYDDGTSDYKESTSKLFNIKSE